MLETTGDSKTTLGQSNGHGGKIFRQYFFDCDLICKVMNFLRYANLSARNLKDRSQSRVVTMHEDWSDAKVVHLIIY